MALTNAQRKLRIANDGLAMIGQKAVTSLTDGSVDANRINGILEDLILELLDEDWNFNRHRVNLSGLTKVYKLTLDAAPTPTAAGWVVGDTLTGNLSGATATVKRVISTTEYLITAPSVDFTDGESISDGTNARDCATGYPVIDESPLEKYEYGYVLPSDWIHTRFLAYTYSDKIKYEFYPEQDMIFCDYDDAILAYNRKIEESTDVADVTKMPLWFWRLISARLAYVLSPNITENQKVQAKDDKELQDAWITAYERNGDANYEQEEHGNDDWVEGYDREIANA